MADTQEAYNKKKMSLNEALGLIRSGDAIFSGLGAAEPQELVRNVHTIKERGVRGCDLTTCLPFGDCEYITNPAYADTVMSSGWFYTAAQRASAKAGGPQISHVPERLHTAVTRRMQAVREDKRRMVLFAACSPMDAHGYLSLSLSAAYERELINEGALVIVEVNPKLPRTFGDAAVHISEIDALVEVDYPAPAIPEVPFTENDRKIAEFIAERIEDGSTIQLGIGGIPNALASGLKDKKHLGIHTEMLTDNMVDLVECGVIDNSMKTLYRHKMVSAFAMGTAKLYNYINDNPSVLMMSASWVNDPHIVGQNYKMQSINTAI
ncbi:MAG: 4-hydroxybutyrate--acetyl-CoA CoA transferase, partial [Clostridiales bacterium]|nr:4-hydroxybutyrate--acetyl-CoA CoA transferase [Clostridiales bacterium]